MAQIGGIFVGVVALAFVAFANVTSMANILYTSLIGLRQVGTNGLRAVRWELLCFLFCVAPLLLIIFTPGVYDGFFRFLVWTSALNSALAGIGIADYFILRRQRLDLRALHSTAPTSAYAFWRGFNPIGLVSLLVGFLVYVAVFNPQWSDIGAGATRKIVVGEGEPKRRLRHVYPSEAEARRAARGELDLAARSALELSGDVAGFEPGLFAGGTLRIADLRPELAGDWQITRVAHRLGAGLATSFDARKAEEQP